MAIHPSQIANGVPAGGSANQVLAKNAAGDYDLKWVTPAAATWASITGKPATFPPSSHNHSAAEITSGTLAVARIPNGTPPGGTTGQLLAKKSATAHDVEWVTKVDGLPANGAWQSIAAGSDRFSVSYRKVANGFVEAAVKFASTVGELELKLTGLPAGFRPHSTVDTVSSQAWFSHIDGAILVEAHIFDDGSIAAGAPAIPVGTTYPVPADLVIYFLYAVA